MLSIYLKCSVWRLAVRLRLIYTSLGAKGLSFCVCNMKRCVRMGKYVAKRSGQKFGSHQVQSVNSHFLQANVRRVSKVRLLSSVRCLLTLILLKWTIWRAPTNASKWRMGFNPYPANVDNMASSYQC